ncbi:protein required for attachment to host cells [Humitalea rosea]|uniref:Protein required for attachment to host cells n=1 Tax=Humitalea rosea TaxID=990373 RepID=A0A2W7IJF3_9PROT|nr:host attachment family protein [Humitalea rosea]PZW46828.1 protein required for attachment to host cells [Humitalea rosea]
MQQLRIPTNAWVLVCDGAKALTFRNDGDTETLSLTLIESRAEAAPPTRELGTGRPGRVVESMGTKRSAVEQTDLHAEAEAVFLAQTIERLGQIVREQDVRHLILVAPPKALGIIRKHLTPALRAVIVHELDKDYAGLTTPDIERHLAG